MSSALYHARLYWVGMRGTAHCGAAHVTLAAPPHLPGMRIDGIDYIPEIGLRQIMPYAHGWRDMTDTEAAAAQTLLDHLVRGSHAPHP